MATGIIDTHHHIYPPNYVAKNLQRLLDDAAILPASAYQNWTPSLALEQMDKAGISSAIASITSPGIWYRRAMTAIASAPATATSSAPRWIAIILGASACSRRSRCRTPNAASRKSTMRSTLKLDGIGLLTSYAGKLIGDPAFTTGFRGTQSPQGQGLCPSNHVVLRQRLPRSHRTDDRIPDRYRRAIASLALQVLSPGVRTSLSSSRMAAARCHRSSSASSAASAR